METVAQLLVPTLLALAYFRRVGHLRRRGQQPSGLRQACFAAGLALILLVTVGPIDDLADEFVYGHMIQHVVLLEEAALLLAIGLTGPVLRPILALPVLRHLRALVYPPVALVLWIVVIYAWHVPALYQAAAEHAGLHFLEHASFLGAGVVMWLALLGPLPKPRWFSNGAKAGFTAAAHFSTMAMANFFMWSGVVLYPIYAASDRAHGLSPLKDQSIAGAVLAVQSIFVMVGVFAWIILQWARQDSERQELLDLADRLGVPLSDDRAARAAAGGGAAELRRRLEQESVASAHVESAPTHG